MAWLRRTQAAELNNKHWSKIYCQSEKFTESLDKIMEDEAHKQSFRRHPPKGVRFEHMVSLHRVQNCSDPSRVCNPRIFAYCSNRGPFCGLIMDLSLLLCWAIILKLLIQSVPNIVVTSHGSLRGRSS